MHSQIEAFGSYQFCLPDWHGLQPPVFSRAGARFGHILDDILCLLETPRAFHFFGLQPHSLPGGPVGTPSSLTRASQQLWANKALWLLRPSREYLSVSLCCFPMKQMIFRSRWLRNTRPMHAFLCDPQTIRQWLPPIVVGASCSVLATFVVRHFSIVGVLLLLIVSFATECLFYFLLEKKIKTVYLLCFVTFISVDGMFDENHFECAIKNCSLWIGLESWMLFRKCHLLFNAWLNGLMASTLILKV